MLFGGRVVGAAYGCYVSTAFGEDVGVGYPDATRAKEQDVGHGLGWCGGYKTKMIVRSAFSSGVGGQPR